jgi:hypothetical protein
VALAVMVAVPLVVSASWAAFTGTFTPVFQLAVVMVTGEETVMSVSPVRLRLTGTLPVGCWLSRRLTVPLLPSPTVSEAGVAAMDGPVGATTVIGISSVAVSSVLSNALACRV